MPKISRAVGPTYEEGREPKPEELPVQAQEFDEGRFFKGQKDEDAPEDFEGDREFEQEAKEEKDRKEAEEFAAELKRESEEQKGVPEEQPKKNNGRRSR